MKTPLIKKIKDLLLKDEFDVQHKLFNFMLAVTFAMAGISVLISFILNPGFIGNITAVLIVLFLGLNLWISVIKGNERLAAILITTIGDLVLLPIFFITNGGTKDGIQLWFLLGLLTPLVALRGPGSVIMFILSVLASAGCMIYEKFCPGSIIHSDNEIACFSVMFISFVFFAVIIGIMFKYQTDIYENQREIMLRKDDELVKAMEEAQNANNAKSRFLAHMSHEIRTPINAVLGMDEMIIRESTDKDITAYAVNIRSAGNSLLSIINDILDFSKIESNKMEIIPAEYDLSLLLKDCYNLVFMRAAEKELRFSFETDGNTPKKLVGDEFRIRQIITNLLTNGVKYTPKGSVSLSLGFDRIDDERIMLIISVKDTGMGISDEDKAKLFDSFRRINSSQTRNIEGTGLGLAITKRLAELMDGTVLVESELGKGSIFTVRIPQRVAGTGVIGVFDPSQNSSPDKKYHESFHAPDARILVVDDVKMNVEVMKGLIKKTLISPDAAYSGEECLALAAKEKYDIIFMDHLMPEMDGVETLKHLKENTDSPNRDTPVIALTANVIAGAKESYMSMGFADYLSKPVKGCDLEDMLIRFLPAEKVVSFSEEVREKVPCDNSDIPGFLNSKEGISFCCGDISFYKEVLRGFVHSGITERLNKYYSARDWDNYSVCIHSIMGTALSIGAEELAAKTAAMKNALKNDNISYVKEHHKGFSESCERLIDRISEYLGEKEEAVSNDL
ncbi:MAG: ATP-binding protein [Huintestinicola sp.]|uniref:ATP-binding protein n=1 Tax=Huintestinicola sp. TaxID=2981661 RepID=UPI003F00B6E3